MELAGPCAAAGPNEPLHPGQARQNRCFNVLLRPGRRFWPPFRSFRAASRRPPTHSQSSRLHNALEEESTIQCRQEEKRSGPTTRRGVVTFIACPDDMIPMARCRAAGRNDALTRNVQSGAKNGFRSHECGPLRTFQFEQLQWWGQRPHRDRGGGSPEALPRFPPRLGTPRCQSISQTRATSTPPPRAHETAKASTWR